MSAWSDIFCPDGNYQVLDRGFQLWHAGRKVVHPNRFDPRVAQRVAYEGMALIADQIRGVPQDVINKLTVVEGSNEISHWSHPVGKWVPGSIFCRQQQVRYQRSAPIEVFG
jgi:hypothetical protein